MQRLGTILGKSTPPIKYKEDSRLVLNDCLIGVEIELEDIRQDLHLRKYRDHGAWNFWKVEEDGSLRGEYAREFVLAAPLAGESLVTALLLLEDVLSTGAKQLPNCSERTSVHVHLNVSDLTTKEIRYLLGLYYAVEPLLFKYVGNNRDKNIYCLPGDIVTEDLLQFNSLGEENIKYLLNNYQKYDRKYSALNLSSLKKYGSLEFRHKGGDWRAYSNLTWINLILCMKRYILEGNGTYNPDELPAKLSVMGEDKFIDDVFGSFADGLKYPGFEKDVREGIRTSQLLLYGENYHMALDYVRDKFQYSPEDDNKNLKAISNYLLTLSPKTRYYRLIAGMYRHVAILPNTDSSEISTFINQNPFDAALNNIGVHGDDDDDEIDLYGEFDYPEEVDNDE